MCVGLSDWGMGGLRAARRPQGSTRREANESESEAGFLVGSRNQARRQIDGLALLYSRSQHLICLSRPAENMYGWREDRATAVTCSMWPVRVSLS